MKDPSVSLPRWLHNPIVQTTVVGLISWLAYLSLTFTYPLKTIVDRFRLTDFGRANQWSQSSLAHFLLSIFGAFLLYLLAWRIVSRHPHDRRLLWLVLAFAALFAVTLLLMYPITATDVFEYVFHSRILVHYGENPLAVPPVVFKGDPFLKMVNWAAHPSPYGPLWVMLTVPGSLVAGDDLMLNLMLMRALPVIFFLGCALVIAAILRHKNPSQQVVGTLLFAWNPLVLFEGPGNAHNGIIMMFFAVGAIYFLVRRQWLWVIPALVASILVKYITAILLIPFLIYCWRAQEGNTSSRVRYLIKTMAISGLLVGVVFAPFLQVPSGLLEEANFYSLLAIPSLAYNFLKGVHGDKIAKVLTIMTSVGFYLTLYALSLRTLARDRRPHHLIVLSTWLLVAYLGIACMHFQPWFAIWPITLGVWVSHPLARRVLVVFTASALLSYAANFVWIWNYRVMQSFQVNAMFVAVIFLPPLIIGLGNRLGARWAFPKRWRVFARA
jgi:alpha-1,6-mannosyltransferase